MSKYTAEDFENAKFAEHPNGIIAARLNYDKLYPWLHNCDEFTDVSMAGGGWVPVPSKPTITESRFYEVAVAHRGGQLTPSELAFRLGVTVIPDQEPTNAEKLERDVAAVLAKTASPEMIAEYLAGRGWTKAPEVDNGRLV